MTDEPIATIVGAKWHDVLADAREVVVHWREVQHHLTDVPSSSAEAALLRAEMQQLREEYARLIAEARWYGQYVGLSLVKDD